MSEPISAQEQVAHETDTSDAEGTCRLCGVSVDGIFEHLNDSHPGVFADDHLGTQ